MSNDADRAARGTAGRPGRPRWLFRVGLLSDVGTRRDRNEDAYTVFVPYGGEENRSGVDALFVVADGMGGHDYGDVASRLAADHVRARLTAPREPDSPAPEPAAALAEALSEVHAELMALAADSGLDRGVGTTATAAAVQDERLTIAHVGDTRLYRWRQGELAALTEDHSWIAEQRRAGIIGEEAAADHPNRNLLTRCLGVGDAVRADIRSETLRAGDRYLLSSDGLHGRLGPDRIAAVLAAEADPQRAARALVAAANEVDGSDNITAVVFHVDVHPALVTTDPGFSVPALLNDDTQTGAVP